MLAISTNVAGMAYKIGCRYPPPPQWLSISSSQIRRRLACKPLFNLRRTTHIHNVRRLLCPIHQLRVLIRVIVYPAHLGFVLLNEGAGDEPASGSTSRTGIPLFASVIQKAGGDVVSTLYNSVGRLCMPTLPNQTLVKRALQRIIVRLPAQSPPPDDISFAPETGRVFREAQSLQKTMHDSYIAQDHILTAVLKAPSLAPVLKEASLTEAALITAIEQIRGNRRIESRTAEQGFDALSKYAVDLTALAEEGKIDPVIGRDNEIRRVIRILCRR
jgi:ATP-dependent Clp protease ATP-binding subunit ClpB